MRVPIYTYLSYLKFFICTWVHTLIFFIVRTKLRQQAILVEKSPDALSVSFNIGSFTLHPSAGVKTFVIKITIFDWRILYFKLLFIWDTFPETPPFFAFARIDYWFFWARNFGQTNPRPPLTRVPKATKTPMWYFLF